MKTNAHQLADHAHYFVPNPSIYPVILSFGMFLLALGFIELINGFHLGKWVMLGGTGVIFYVLFNCSLPPSSVRCSTCESFRCLNSAA